MIAGQEFQRNVPRSSLYIHRALKESSFNHIPLNKMLSNYMYTWFINGSGFSQIGGHEFQRDVLRFSLQVYKAYRWSWFESDWCTWVLTGCSDSRCRYTRPESESGFNQIGGHGF